MPTEWTPDLRARFWELREQGLTFAAIALMLSSEFHVKLTKNACVGMAHRPVNGATVHPTLLERRPGQCKFPIGADKPQRFCGRRVTDRQAYCSEHYSVMYARDRYGRRM